MGLTLAMTLIFEFSRSYVILTIWWPRSGVRIYQIVTGVTSVVGVPSTHLVMFMKMSDNTFSSSITNFPSIQFSPFFNNLWGRQNSLCWQCMVYYRNLWNSSIGNKWPIYMHAALVIMHGRPDVKLVGSAAHYMSRSVLSFPMINVVEVKPLQQFKWFW